LSKGGEGFGVDDAGPGDFVVVTWRDHYRIHEKSPSASTFAIVETPGIVAEISDVGVALFHNRVKNYEELGAAECMDGQLILRECISDLRVVEKAR